MVLPLIVLLENSEKYICMFSIAADPSYSDAMQQARSAVEVVQEFGRSSLETNVTLTVSSHNISTHMH